MKNRCMKRMISTLLLITMVITSVPGDVFAEKIETETVASTQIETVSEDAETVTESASDEAAASTPAAPSESESETASAAGDSSGGTSAALPEGMSMNGSNLVIAPGSKFNTDEIASAVKAYSATAIENSGTITEGKASVDVPVHSRQGSVIMGGTFNEVVSGYVNIQGGTFNEALTNPSGRISGGTFKQTIDTGSSTLIISGGTIEGNVKGRNIVISGGTFTETSNVDITVVGGIEGGVFYGYVSCRYALLRKGTFYGTVENRNGSFYEDEANDLVFDKKATIINSEDGKIYAGVYPCKVVNYGVIYGGTFNGEVINHGTILGGEFEDPVENNSIIMDGVFNARTTNFSLIAGGTFNAILVEEGDAVTLSEGLTISDDGKTLILQSGYSFATDELAKIEKKLSSVEWLELHGAITGGSTLLTVNVKSVSGSKISGGTFSGTISGNINISGGTFTGELDKVYGYISGGEFKNTVYEQEYYLSISGGTFEQKVSGRSVGTEGGTFHGDVEIETVGGLSGGEFYGNVLLRQGTIFGGSFHGDVTNYGGVICEGTKNGLTITFDENITITNNGTLDAAEYPCRVVNNGTIEDGNYTNTVENYGVINGGTFTGNVTNFASGVIRGGKFEEAVKNEGRISGGEFDGEITDSEGGIVLAEGLEISDDRTKLTIEAGNAFTVEEILKATSRMEVTSIENHGTISAGGTATLSAASSKGGALTVSFVNGSDGRVTGVTFAQDVTNQGMIADSVFENTVENTGSISGSTFEAAVTNSGTISASDFNSDVTNSESGTITGSSFYGEVTNGGTIKDSVFEQTVSNKGTISGAVFNGTVTNESAISGSTFNGEIRALKNGSITDANYGENASVTDNSGKVEVYYYTSLNGTTSKIQKAVYGANVLKTLGTPSSHYSWYVGFTAAKENRVSAGATFGLETKTYVQMKEGAPAIPWDSLEPGAVTYGQKLSSSKLPTNAQGTFAWKEPNTNVTVEGGKTGYTVVFTPSSTSRATYDYTGVALEAPVKVTVNPKDVTIKLSSTSKTYGSPDGKLSGTVSGVVSTDSFSLEVTREPGEAVGTYNLIASWTENPNYKVEVVPGTMKINKYSVTVTPNSLTKKWGEADPQLTAAVTAVPNGCEPVNYTLTREKGESVGTYAITAVAGDNPNYQVTIGAKGKLTVTAKSIDEAAIGEITEQKFTGSSVEPGVLIKDNGVILKAGTDYTVSYKNNILPGTATATITGKGNYQGTVVREFTIITEDGWKQVGEKKYYVLDDVIQTGWQTIIGKKYYFGPDGVMQTGWQTIGGKKYYLDPTSGAVSKGIVTISGKKYGFDSDGVMVTGLQTIGGAKYYLDSSGIVQTGWQTISSKKYYFDTDGIMLTDWQVIDGKKYYLNVSGVMQTGWQTISGKKYYLSTDGAMQTGWQTISSKKYYFDLTSGVVSTGIVTISGKKYGFDSDGVMLTGLQTIGGAKYYLDNSGMVQTDWQTIGGKKYYFNASGVMQTGWQMLSGKKYYLGTDGAMQTGWQTISSKKYYFNSNGVMATGWKTISGKKYYFNSSGVMQTGWKTISGKKYYFNSKGVMLTGKQKIKGKTYNFGKDGVLKKGK